MLLLRTVKTLSISLGLYRAARWFSWRLRPALHRAYEDDIRFYRSLLPTGALCFDVGANIGDKSETLLKAGAKVVAFEPQSEALPELIARCGREKNWMHVATALGSRSAITTLYVNRGQSSLAGPGRKVISNYHVPIVTLDAAIQAFGKPYYCKIDVEGWELEVLKGLTQAIPLISIEFHLNDRDIAKTLLCLDRLLEFGPSQVNITPAECSSFYWQEWMRLEQFLKWFPADLKYTLPGDSYGDIFIKQVASVR